MEPHEQADTTAIPTSVLDQQESNLPLSRELLEYYRQRVLSAEDTLAALTQRLDDVHLSHADLHKSRWALHKRNADVGDLQRALSDSHIFVYEEKEKNRKLQAENDQLRQQEAEDRRKIQHLLSLVEPITQDVNYARGGGAPDTLTMRPHARGSIVHPPVAATATGSSSGGGRAAAASGSSRTATRSSSIPAPPQPAARVIRTVHMPNEKVETLEVQIEGLRAQLQEQEELSRERVAALLEDRRLRVAEESARRSAEAEQMRELDDALKKSEGLLHRTTRDYLALKHETLKQQRVDTERLETLQRERDNLTADLRQLREDAASEVKSASASAKRGAEQYVTLFRQQVADTERTLGLLKDQHHGLQQALAMRVKELEESLASLRTKHRSLEQRRKLDAEGYQQELSMIQKQLSRIEVRVYGRQAHDRVERAAGVKGGQRRKVDVNALRGRLEALERMSAF